MKALFGHGRHRHGRHHQHGATHRHDTIGRIPSQTSGFHHQGSGPEDDPYYYSEDYQTLLNTGFVPDDRQRREVLVDFFYKHAPHVPRLADPNAAVKMIHIYHAWHHRAGPYAPGEVASRWRSPWEYAHFEDGLKIPGWLHDAGRPGDGGSGGQRECGDGGENGGGGSASAGLRSEDDARGGAGAHEGRNDDEQSGEELPGKHRRHSRRDKHKHKDVEEERPRKRAHKHKDRDVKEEKPKKPEHKHKRKHKGVKEDTSKKRGQSKQRHG